MSIVDGPRRRVAARRVHEQLQLDPEDGQLHLVLNKTNYRSLCEITGASETEEWIGTRIQLVSVRVDFQGRRVSSIRIEPAPVRSVAAPPAGEIDAVGI